MWRGTTDLRIAANEKSRDNHSELFRSRASRAERSDGAFAATIGRAEDFPGFPKRSVRGISRGSIRNGGVHAVAFYVLLASAVQTLDGE